MTLPSASAVLKGQLANVSMLTWNKEIWICVCFPLPRWSAAPRDPPGLHLKEGVGHEDPASAEPEFLSREFMAGRRQERRRRMKEVHPMIATVLWTNPVYKLLPNTTAEWRSQTTQIIPLVRPSGLQTSQTRCLCFCIIQQQFQMSLLIITNITVFCFHQTWLMSRGSQKKFRAA